MKGYSQRGQCMEKQVHGHPEYWVTDKGDVISTKWDKRRVLKQDTSTGYPRVNIDGRKLYVANIVAEHFLKKPFNPNYKIFYIDGDTENCELENLAYLSASDIQRFKNYTVEYRREVLGLGN